MNNLTRKFVSVFFSAIFFFASGTGQLIHAAFHDHNYNIQSRATSTTVSIKHNYCTALQLALPEFFQAGDYTFEGIIISKELFFANPEPAIPHLFSFKNSDRAPPVLV